MRLLDRVLEISNNLRWSLGPYIPGTRMNAIWRSLDKQGKQILDVGGGEGLPMRFINRHKRRFTANADFSFPSLKRSKGEGIHNECVLCDARKLPFRGKSFDIVLCTEVIEHIEKEKGFELIENLEEIGRKQVIISTPVHSAMIPDTSGTLDPGHISSWSPAEFRKLGYKVRGVDGIHLTRDYILTHSLHTPLRLLYYLPHLLAGPFVYFFPRLAGGMVCVKNLNG